MITKVQTVKLKDTAALNKKVEELKSQEGKELGQLNKLYMELDLKVKKLDKKNDRYETVIGSLIDSWAKKRKTKQLEKEIKQQEIFRRSSWRPGTAPNLLLSTLRICKSSKSWEN